MRLARCKVGRALRRAAAGCGDSVEFTAAPLEAVVAEFNRTNRLQLSIAEAGIAEVRLSASFRSDNVEGFVRFLEASRLVRVERRGRDEIVVDRQR